MLIEKKHFICDLQLCGKEAVEPINGWIQLNALWFFRHVETGRAGDFERKDSQPIMHFCCFGHFVRFCAIYLFEDGNKQQLNVSNVGEGVYVDEVTRTDPS